MFKFKQMNIVTTLFKIVKISPLFADDLQYKNIIECLFEKAD